MLKLNETAGNLHLAAQRKAKTENELHHSLLYARQQSLTKGLLWDAPREWIAAAIVIGLPQVFCSSCGLYSRLSPQELPNDYQRQVRACRDPAGGPKLPVRDPTRLRHPAGRWPESSHEVEGDFVRRGLDAVQQALRGQDGAARAHGHDPLRFPHQVRDGLLEERVVDLPQRSDAPRQEEQVDLLRKRALEAQLGGRAFADHLGN